MFQLSHLYMTTGKTVALTIQTFVGKVMSLLFNTPSRFVIAFLPKSKRLLIVMLEKTLQNSLDGKEIKPVSSKGSPSYSLEGLMLKLQYFGHLKQRADSL